MFQKIAKVNLDNGWGVELGYEVPQVITQDTVMQLTTKIVKEEGEVDVESVEYKQAESVSEVLKIGFEIGCSYTTKVIEQTTKMGQKLMADGVANEEATVTGEATTSDLVLE